MVANGLFSSWATPEARRPAVLSRSVRSIWRSSCLARVTSATRSTTWAAAPASGATVSRSTRTSPRTASSCSMVSTRWLATAARRNASTSAAGAGGHAQRRRQQRAQPLRARQLRVSVARVVPEVGALHRAALRHRPPRDALALVNADGRDQLLRQVEAGHRREHTLLVTHHDAARGDAEHGPRLLHDDVDRALDVEARGDRAPGLQQGPHLARAVHALLEELRVLDRDAGLLGEGFQHALVVGG